MLSTRKVYDAVVVGAGHNGLTAGAFLAQAGLSILVLERRDIVGGSCVTEEISPGCRASTTSYIASMLLPEVVRGLDLKAHGLRMVPCRPAVQIPFPDQDRIALWPDRDRTVEELKRFSVRDAAAYLRVDGELKKLARYLQPFFLEPPPDIMATGLDGLRELLRVGKRFLGISGGEIGRLVSFLTGSLGDFLDRTYESEKVKALFLANNVYGKHGGPYHPGSALGLLFHLLPGGDEGHQGFSGHVIGGMGAITRAMAEAGRAAGAEIRASSPVARIDVRDGRVRGVVLEDGTEIASGIVLSNADPKRTFLKLVEPKELPDAFRRAIAGIKMAGPCAKVNLVLAEEPRTLGIPSDDDPGRRSKFALVPSLDFAERSYHAAMLGRIPDELWLSVVVASTIDRSLAPEGRHIVTCFVQYVPYELREGTWDERREELGDRVVRRLSEHAPNVPGAILARQVLTPLDFERTYGLTEGNIFHGDLSLEQLFFMRPVPGWSRYRTPVEGLYLCGAGAHPGGGVTGAPGYNAARMVLADRARFRSRLSWARASQASDRWRTVAGAPPG